jgi:hypothetical protein
VRQCRVRSVVLEVCKSKEGIAAGVANGTRNQEKSWWRRKDDILGPNIVKTRLGCMAVGDKGRTGLCLRALWRRGHWHEQKARVERACRETTRQDRRGIEASYYASGLGYGGSARFSRTRCLKHRACLDDHSGEGRAG